MFAQCKEGKHQECRAYLSNGSKCNCPCHSGKPIPKHPCKRCGGSGTYPSILFEGICLRCKGTGEEPNFIKNI